MCLPITRKPSKQADSELENINNVLNRKESKSSRMCLKGISESVSIENREIFENFRDF